MNERNALIMHLNITKADKVSPSVADTLLNEKTLTENELLSYNPQMDIPTPYDGNNLHESMPKQLSQTQQVEGVAAGAAASSSGGNGDGDSNSEGEVPATSTMAAMTEVLRLREASNKRRDVAATTDATAAAATAPSSGLRASHGGSSANNNHHARSTCTSTHCWWCCHAFDGAPYSMPINKLNGQYKTVGCFCMPECVVAYIFGGGGRFGNTDRMYSLLHEVVLERNPGRTPPPIKRAANRETLDIFGGPYDIAAFRKLSGDYQRDMRTYVPPLRPVALAFEETSVSYDRTAALDRNRVTARAPPPAALSNSERVAKAAKQLRLRRAKRSTSENTLESFMNLRIKESRRDAEEEAGAPPAAAAAAGGGPPIRVC